MPQFYFDLRRGNSVLVDNEGSELPNAEEAYLEAYESARELWGDLLKRREDPRRHSFDVRDADRNILFTVPFQEVVDSCVGAKKTELPFTAAIKTADHTRRAANELQREMELLRANLREAHTLLLMKV